MHSGLYKMLNRPHTSVRNLFYHFEKLVRLYDTQTANPKFCGRRDNLSI